MAQYYILYNGRQVGPLEKSQLAMYGLNASSKVWTDGMPTWMDAGMVPDLADVLGSVPPPFPGGQGSQPWGAVPPIIQAPKDRIAFGVLALIIGALGVQYFYVGKVIAGLLTILLSFVTCGIWSIVTFVQGIVVLCGTQEEFDRKFVYSNSVFPLF